MSFKISFKIHDGRKMIIREKYVFLHFYMYFFTCTLIVVSSFLYDIFFMHVIREALLYNIFFILISSCNFCWEIREMTDSELITDLLKDYDKSALPSTTCEFFRRFL